MSCGIALSLASHVASADNQELLSGQNGTTAEQPSASMYLVSIAQVQFSAVAAGKLAHFQADGK